MNKILSYIVAGLILVITFAGILLFGYLILAGLCYLICLAFGLEWSWLLPLGVYALMFLARIFIRLVNADRKK